MVCNIGSSPIVELPVLPVLPVPRSYSHLHCSQEAAAGKSDLALR